MGLQRQAWGRFLWLNSDLHFEVQRAHACVRNRGEVKINSHKEFKGDGYRNDVAEIGYGSIVGDYEGISVSRLR